MARTIKGKDIGNGNGVVYTLRASDEFRLDAIAFTLKTDATVANRFPEVILLDDAGLQVARVPDWNDCPASVTVRYTFGVDLVPFSCAVNDGGAVQNSLPDTQLGPRYQVQVRSVGNTGAVFTGDTITDVVLAVTDAEPNVAADLGGGAPFMFVPGPNPVTV